MDETTFAYTSSDGTECTTLDDEVKAGNATHIRHMGDHHKVLIRFDGEQVQALDLARIGRSIENPTSNLWYRVRGGWRDIDYNPVGAVLWPAMEIESKKEEIR